MRKFYNNTTAKISAFGLLLLAPATASAQTPQGLTGAKTSIGTSGDGIGAGVDGGGADLTTLIGKLINTFLGLLGIILVLYIIYAGWLRLSSQGDSGKIETSNKMIINAVIGMIIVVAAFAIANFVLEGLTSAVA